MYCSKCGAELQEGAIFCSRCGNRLNGVPTQQMVQQTIINKENIVKKASSIFNIFNGKSLYIIIMVAIAIFTAFAPFYKILNTDVYQTNMWNGMVSQAMDEDTNVIGMVSVIFSSETTERDEEGTLIGPIIVIVIFAFAVAFSSILFVRDALISKYVSDGLLKANAFLVCCFGATACWVKFAYQKFADEYFAYAYEGQYTLNSVVWILVIAGLVNYLIVYKAYEAHIRKVNQNN